MEDLGNAQIWTKNDANNQRFTLEYLDNGYYKIVNVKSKKVLDVNGSGQADGTNVLEKPIQQGNIEWYVIECEDGRRLQLRSFQGNRLIIAVGDIGIISYKGKTIQSFQRER